MEELRLPSFATPQREDTKTPSPVALPEDFEPLVEYSSDEWMQRAWRYVTDRGCSREQIAYTRVGFSGVGKYRARVVFPIYDKRKLLGFSGRVLVDKQPKWLHSPGLTAPYCVQYQQRECVTVVEGIFDALSVDRSLSYVTDSVALLGTHLSEDKMRWLDVYNRIILWMDPDVAGRKSTMQIAQFLAIDCDKEVFVVQSASEPADLMNDNLQEAFQNKRRWTTREGFRWMV